jgi:nitrate/TMAO reductase-like tetraheme cytochrome c subunit
MSKYKKVDTRKPKTFPIFPVLGAVLLAAMLLTASGFAFAYTQEEHDTFCSSCHTQPESTFYQRASGAQAIDLASFHKAKGTRCIDCHSGAGLTGRMQAELLGAHNTLAL